MAALNFTMDKTHLKPFPIIHHRLSLPSPSPNCVIDCVSLASTRQGLFTTKQRLVVEAKARKRANTRTQNAKVLDRRWRKKYKGTPSKPRLSVFCSDKQLYAMLVDDENKKCLFYGSTLQKSIRDDPGLTTAEAAKLVGEELVKAAIDLDINEISSYDRNGFALGERMEAFEFAISHHGFLPH